MKNTFLDFELENGEVIKLTLNFTRLLQLKNKRKNIYEKYNNILLKGTKDVIEDSIITLYTAYLCANIEHLEDNILMSLETFTESIPQNFILMNETVQNLVSPKKKTDLENHSLKKQEK